jgi:hypothetical protein
MRADYLGGDATTRYTLTDPVRSPSIDLTPSALTYQTADTPLVGLKLVSTPLAGENYHMPYDNSIMSKASSHLFGEDIVDPHQADYIHPPPHLLPRKELLFMSSTNDLVYELSASKAQEGGAPGMVRNDKLLKRVKDKRRQRRSGEMSGIVEDFI